MNEETRYVTWDVHREFAQRVDDENKRQNKRLETIEANIEETRKLTISVEKMAVSMENMAGELKNQSERLVAIEKEPADKWKQASWIVISVLITAVVTFALTRVGL